MEGGGPYAYPRPALTARRDRLRSRADGAGSRKDLGATPEFSQGQWDKLLQVLDTGRIDLVVNGYEWTENRARDYLATRPYYVYQLQLMARRGGSIRSWADLKQPTPGRRALDASACWSARRPTPSPREQGGPHVEVVRFDGATDAMMAVQNGQYDATLQDVPAALFYRDRFPGLELVGPPESHGYYVIYVRRRTTRRCATPSTSGLARLIDVGRAAAALREIRHLDRRPERAGRL